MTDRIPVLLDTDPGSDIDDAICLAYLLAQPRCELVGVTTVSGRDPRQRASIVDAVCRKAGRTDIPIHAGVSVRYDEGTVVQPDVPQFAALAKYPHRRPEEFPSNTAVEYLRRTIDERPGEITLLAIGPMSNLGALLAIDPEVPKKLKALVLMCGVFTNRLPWVGPREWNALADSCACKAVYRAPVAVHRSIGLDVTMQVKLKSADAIERFRTAGGPLDVVADCCEIWRQHGHDVVFHDPLAAVSIFDPTICTWERGRVEVEPGQGRAGGMTHWKAEADGPHEVAMEVDADLFFREYFGTVTRR
jgi:purine nucleosidase